MKRLLSAAALFLLLAPFVGEASSARTPTSSKIAPPVVPVSVAEVRLISPALPAWDPAVLATPAALPAALHASPWAIERPSFCPDPCPAGCDACFPCHRSGACLICDC